MSQVSRIVKFSKNKNYNWIPWLICQPVFFLINVSCVIPYCIKWFLHLFGFQMAFAIVHMSNVNIQMVWIDFHHTSNTVNCSNMTLDKYLMSKHFALFPLPQPNATAKNWTKIQKSRSLDMFFFCSQKVWNEELHMVNRADSTFSILKIVSLIMIVFYHLQCITFDPNCICVFV